MIAAVILMLSGFVFGAAIGYSAAKYPLQILWQIVVSVAVLFSACLFICAAVSRKNSQ